MKFWDTSAIVPLLIEDRDSMACRDALRLDPSITVWVGTKVEIVAALAARARAGRISSPELVKGLERAARLARKWYRVNEFDRVFRSAEEVALRHGLRAGDSLQLAAALVLADGRPKGVSFVCRDADLANAAESERLEVLRPRLE